VLLQLLLGLASPLMSVIIQEHAVIMAIPLPIRRLAAGVAVWLLHVGAVLAAGAAAAAARCSCCPGSSWPLTSRGRAPALSTPLCLQANTTHRAAE
jgi:hypothetical protein